MKYCKINRKKKLCVILFVQKVLWLFNDTFLRHLNVMGICPEPSYQCCYLEDETSKHILCECEFFSSLMFEYLERHLLEPWELQNISVRCLLKATGLLS